MAQTIETQIEIDAPTDQVWATFSEFDKWPEWNPFVVSLTGDVTVGGKIQTRLEPPGGRAMGFKPKVVALDAGQKFAWVGNLLFPGIFDGEHQFILEPLDGDRTRFIQREEFTGLLVGLIMRMVRDSTTQGFEDSNKALKDRVEQTGA